MGEGLDSHRNMTHLRDREEAGRAGSEGASGGAGEAEMLQELEGAGPCRLR